jgi:sterol desaturase/sphingolipid hydroxylase (fatty acid hydroxylase superfamily)
VVSNVAFFSFALFLELCLLSGLFDNSLITYSKTKSRSECIQATRDRISVFSQLKGCLWVLSGPTMVVSMLINVFVMDYLCPASVRTASNWPSMGAFICQVVLMLIIGDFSLYWGHRIQHMNEFLWKSCHWYHHQLDTPTPISTVYINKTDATLQGGLPLLIASFFIRPHPYVVYAFMAIRLADNAVNHCGMDSVLINTLFLKCLPFRGSVGHHDSHHKYSNYTKNAKNFGEYFDIWDKIFG